MILQVYIMTTGFNYLSSVSEKSYLSVILAWWMLKHTATPMRLVRESEVLIRGVMNSEHFIVEVAAPKLLNSLKVSQKLKVTDSLCTS